MPKFAANLTMLFNEVEFLDRFDAAAQVGFRGVEYLFPYAYDRNQLADKLKTLKLNQVLHNLPAGDWGAGDRGNACQPTRVGEFQDGVGKAIDYATALECTRVNCMSGIAPKDASVDALRKTFVENLRFAAAKLKAAGIQLLIEPINTYDMPGFYLSRSAQALEIMDQVGSDNLFLQYDCYHMQRMEGELAANLKTHLARIGHIQIADNPGRNEPGTGEINYSFLFKHIDEIGYDGWIACEYKPAAATAAGLGWAKAYLSQQ